MKIMSFNVLCYGPDDNDWTVRQGRVTKIISDYAPDTFGLQEAHYDWMKVMFRDLPQYDYVGVGRDDGDKGGEFSPVFYLKDKFRVIDKGNFWLSETPDKPGKGWDAACVRVCSYAVLEEIATGKKFAHFNTHLDHVGPVAQREGAKMIAERCVRYPDIPAVITGDFNVTPDSAPYATVLSAGFKDSRDIAEVSDTSHTFHAFDKPIREGGKLAREIIDYVFVKDTGKVNTFKVITDLVDGKYPSDHYPVIADVDI